MNKNVVWVAGIAATLWCVAGFAEDRSVEGCWSFESEDSVILLRVTDGQLAGTIVAAEHETFQEGEDIGTPGAPRTDVVNPDPQLRDRPVVGLDIVSASWDGEIWRGSIYDPGSGKTYSSTVETRRGKLRLRGYIGVSLFGRTETLRRVSSDVAWSWMRAGARQNCAAVSG